jgi:Ca-activated chloride channel homolog
VSFAWPLALLALVLVPVLIALYAWVQRRRRRYVVRFTNVALLRDVVGRSPGYRRHLPAALFLLGLAALLVSLARPSMVLAVPRNEASVMLVIDVSGSMSAADLQPTRLGAAKQAAKTLVGDLPQGVQVGLVSFSDTASLNAPLSDNSATVLQALDSLHAVGGTAIGDGLSLALDQLAQRPTDVQGNRPPAIVILLSDGESNAGQPPAVVVARAQQLGVTVDTVGIGQRGVTTVLNRQVRVGLDEATLQNIAETTGGQYFYAGDATQLQQVYSKLGSMIEWVPEPTEITALVTGLGAALLTVAGLFSMGWFGRLP